MSENLQKHQFKLFYFDLRCRAELVRLLFAFTDVKFEDIRIPLDQWPPLKPRMPMGQVPVLEVDGQQICQSTAIARYLAREFGLNGRSNLEAARADMLIDGVYDLWGCLRAVYMAKLNQKPEEMKQEWAKFDKEHFQTFLDRYQKFLENSKTEWFVSDKITWADIGIAEFLSCVRDSFCPEALHSHAHLSLFVNKVLNLPQLKPYVDSRSQVPF